MGMATVSDRFGVRSTSWTPGSRFIRRAASSSCASADSHAELVTPTPLIAFRECNSEGSFARGRRSGSDRGFPVTLQVDVLEEPDHRTGPAGGALLDRHLVDEREHDADPATGGAVEPRAQDPPGAPRL